MRINRFLALNLNVSRRDSDTLVENKTIKINGTIAQHGDLVSEDDIVMHKNQVIQAIKEHEYYLFYHEKPTLCPDRCQGPARRLQTSQKRGYPTSTNTQAPAACADLALACNTNQIGRAACRERV